MSETISSSRTGFSWIVATCAVVAGLLFCGPSSAPCVFADTLQGEAAVRGGAVAGAQSIANSSTDVSTSPTAADDHSRDDRAAEDETAADADADAGSHQSEEHSSASDSVAEDETQQEAEQGAEEESVSDEPAQRGNDSDDDDDDNNNNNNNDGSENEAAGGGGHEEEKDEGAAQTGEPAQQQNVDGKEDQQPPTDEMSTDSDAAENGADAAKHKQPQSDEQRTTGGTGDGQKASTGDGEGDGSDSGTEGAEGTAVQRQKQDDNDDDDDADTAEQSPAPEKPDDGDKDNEKPAPGRKKPKKRDGKRKKGGEDKNGIEEFFDDLGLFQGVTLSGNNTLTLQEHTVEGSKNSFQSQRWDTDPLMRTSSLHLEGPVWKEFVFQADISDSGYGRSYSRWVGGYVGNDTAVLYGDLNLSLGGNEFIGFRKSTEGWQFDQRLPGNGFMRGFYTKEKGEVHRETFTGNGTSGPYFLTYTPVIRDSQVVKVNEEFMEFGEDYRLDYDTGKLSFDPTGGDPRIITSTDTISVSYLSSGRMEAKPGAFYGARAEFPLLDDRLLLGITTLQEDRIGGDTQADTVGFQEDIYYGSGTTGPFDTNFRPIISDGTSVVDKGERQVIDDALKVLVDGVEQVEGTDYDAYRNIGRIIFRRAVPPTSLVKVRYYYDIQQDTEDMAGDQSNWGLDASYRLNDNTNLSLQWAKSSAATDDKSGTALSTALDYSTGDFSLLGEYRSTDPTYAYVNSVGFRRREQGLNIGAEWRINDNIFISDRYSVHDSDSGLSFGYSGYGGGYNFSGRSNYGGYGSYGGYNSRSYSQQTRTDTGDLSVETSRNDMTLRLTFPGWPDMNLSRSTMSNSGGTTAGSEYVTDTVSASYSPANADYSIRTRYNSSTQRTASTTDDDDGDGTDTSSGSDSDQWQTSLNYTPSDNLSFSASLANSSSSSVDTDESSSSETMQLTADWSPSSEFGIQLSQSVSDSTGSVSSGYYSTYNYGSTTPPTGGIGSSPPSGGYYPPGGGTGDDDNETGEEEVTGPGITDTNRRISMHWRPSQKLSFDLSFGSRDYSSSGSQGYLADSNQNFWNFATMWQATDAVALNLSLASDKMEFLEEDRGAVTNDSFIVSADYRPPGKNWNAGLSLNMQNGSSPTYVGYGRLQRYKMVSTELSDVRGRLSYRLNDNLSLQASAGISDFNSGYSNFEKTNGEISARYRLSSTTGIDFGYRYIRHISRATEDSLIYGTTGSGENYIADSIILRVSTNFRGGVGNRRTRSLGASYGMGGGFGGGASTFGGYQPSLRRGGTTGSRYGTGYGRRGGYGGGISSGFDQSMQNNYSTGYGPSEFDRIGSGVSRRRRSTGDMFDTGRRTGRRRGRMRRTRPPSGEGIETGIGEFAEDRGADIDIGKPETRMRQRPRRQPGRQQARKQTPTQRTPSEDWWLLEDNVAYW